MNTPDVVMFVLFFLAIGVTFGGAMALAWWLQRRKPPESDDDEGLIHCPQCGYDLRVTPLRCPECGALCAENLRRLKLRELRSRLPNEELEIRTPGREETQVVLLESADLGLVTVLQEFLLARGVQTTFLPNGSTRVDLILPAGNAHRLVVWSEDAEYAKALLVKLLGEHAKELAAEQV